MKQLLAVLTFLVILGHAEGQTIQLKGSQLSLPAGNVIGAAFNHDQLILQQSVLTAQGGTIRSQRRLLLIDAKSGTIIKTAMLPATNGSLVGNHCGDVAADPDLISVYVCSSAGTISVLNVETLRPRISIDCEHRIETFGLDEVHHRLFVISQDPAGQYLTVFDATNGAKLESVTTSTGVIDSAQLAVNPHTQRLALAESVLKHSGYKTDIYACMYGEHLRCDPVTQTGQVSQIALSGNELLTASGLLNDDPHICLEQTNIVTKATSRPYCAPGGVHYGVGALSDGYIVAYTGISKRLHFKEETKPLESSVSLWKIEDPQVAATASQQGQEGAFLGGARIASSGRGNEFLLFSNTSNIAVLYRLYKDS